MNLAKRPFRLNVGFLINQPAGYSREIPFEIDKFNFEGDFEVRDITGAINLTRTRNGIRTLIACSAKTDAECGRCLEPFALQLQTEFEQVYTFENRPLSEEEEIIPADGYIDFESLIRQYLLMEIPINPLCELTCQGLCSICGQNLNEETCEHEALVLNEALLETNSHKFPEDSTHSG